MKEGGEERGEERGPSPPRSPLLLCRDGPALMVLELSAFRGALETKTAERKGQRVASGGTRNPAQPCLPRLVPFHPHPTPLPPFPRHLTLAKGPSTLVHLGPRHHGLARPAPLRQRLSRQWSAGPPPAALLPALLPPPLSPGDGEEIPYEGAEVLIRNACGCCVSGNVQGHAERAWNGMGFTGPSNPSYSRTLLRGMTDLSL